MAVASLDKIISQLTQSALNIRKVNVAASKERELRASDEPNIIASSVSADTSNFRTGVK